MLSVSVDASLRCEIEDSTMNLDGQQEDHKSDREETGGLLRSEGREAALRSTLSRPLLSLWYHIKLTTSLIFYGYHNYKDNIITFINRTIHSTNKIASSIDPLFSETLDLWIRGYPGYR